MGGGRFVRTCCPLGGMLLPPLPCLQVLLEVIHGQAALGGLRVGAQHQLPVVLLLGMLLLTAWGCPGVGRLGVLGRVWGFSPSMG